MSLRWYVTRRLLWTGIATFIALTITFLLLSLSPNTGEMQAAFQAAAQGGDVDVAMETYRRARGLDQPILSRYIDYMTNMLTLNWGWSTTRSQPVMQAIANAWPYSAQYIIPSTIIAVVFGYGIGLYSAMHQYTISDYIGTFIAFFGISIPNFWFAIMLILIGSVWLQDQSVLGISLAPLAPSVYYNTNISLLSIANLHQLIFPIIVVSTASVAGQMRYSRAQALEYVNADFVKTARAKGASEWRILIRHILRVALVPLSTILVADVLAIMFAGAVIAEVIFQIPGIGLLQYKAILQQDTPLILATTLIPVFIAIFGNLLQDLVYVWLDPRIDYGDR